MFHVMDSQVHAHISHIWRRGGGGLESQRMLTSERMRCPTTNMGYAGVIDFCPSIQVEFAPDVLGQQAGRNSAMLHKGIFQSNRITESIMVMSCFKEFEMLFVDLIWSMAGIRPCKTAVVIPWPWEAGIYWESLSRQRRIAALAAPPISLYPGF